MDDYTEKLREALADGPLRTGYLDIAVLGDVFLPGLLGYYPPYSRDLGTMVDSGEVKWWRDESDDVWYSLEEVAMFAAS